jgi:hypothetical protein
LEESFPRIWDESRCERLPPGMVSILLFCEGMVLLRFVDVSCADKAKPSIAAIDKLIIFFMLLDGLKFKIFLKYCCFSVCYIFNFTAFDRSLFTPNNSKTKPSFFKSAGFLKKGKVAPNWEKKRTGRLQKHSKYGSKHVDGGKLFSKKEGYSHLAALRILLDFEKSIQYEMVRTGVGKTHLLKKRQDPLPAVQNIITTFSRHSSNRNK